jgi:glutaredoxin
MNWSNSVKQGLERIYPGYDNHWMTGLCLVVCLFMLSFSTATEADHSNPGQIEVFIKQGCPFCDEAEDYLADLGKRYPRMSVSYHDVSRDRQARARLQELADTHHYEIYAVPAFLVGDTFIVGFGGKATTGKAIEEAFLETLGSPLEEQSSSGVVSLPLIGQVDVKQLGLRYSRLSWAW